MTRSAASIPTVPLVQEGPVRWRIERHGAMRVPGIVFASKTLLPDVLSDRSLNQVVNVAALPGIVEASYAMPARSVRPSAAVPSPVILVTEKPWGDSDVTGGRWSGWTRPES